ncbi:MAG: hypothetical protein ABI758_07145 [Candidatus Woesebacteria bacterium]
MRKTLFGLIFLAFLLWNTPVYAKGEVLGIHILSTGEIDQANTLLEHGDDKDKFVTIPLTIKDLDRKGDWQGFFDKCQTLKIHPIIRFVTSFENEAWKQPSRNDVLALTKFLSDLDWHRPELTVILFNEPNHANEWGGKIDPEGFAQISAFAASWLKTEPKTYTVLPAAMDLAADGHNGTQEAFAYWQEALKAEPKLFEFFDGWNSHSYPNPAFAAAPMRTGKNSLRGYTTELDFVKKYTDKQLPVYITETGWNQNVLSNVKLRSYFTQAYEQIWTKDPRIVAVTPFLLQGAPGTFAPFSFLDANGKPTIAYDAYRTLLNEKN